ncbi:FAD-dependent oxidoreductase [Oceanicola sp. 22II-s10i]|uniref:NAD(P)/FAD-dependent oxidoreductase n=1 Tax=Oceanicola sp. 22II-s10i TaxID=1317116 RepID=UPI000B5254C3|nr:FAD-dependent oxidoreductase [Oceanicola sp. 22II-s10i]OWU86242.1 FAD-dependent oxidoreductase [Oceanicola sp. 22II-s10i]
MKRPFGSFAYSDGPAANCYWGDAVPEQDLAMPQVQGDLTADVVVIGGGYTGLNAALALAEAGENVVVLDARYPGWGASGRNGGFCCLGGTRAEDHQLDKRHGGGAAAEVRRAELASIRHVEGLIDRLDLDVDRHSEGETILAHSPAKAAQLDDDRRWFEAAYGVECDLIPGDQMVQHGLGGSFHGALTVPLGFALHPRKYLAGLVDAARAAGARIHGNSPALSVTRAGTGWRVHSLTGHVTARRLIVATNGYSSEDIPDWMRHRFLPAQSSVVATRRITDEERAAQGWTSYQMAYEDRRLLHYFHMTPDNRMVFGQRGGLISSRVNERRIANRVRRDLARLFPKWAEVETTHQWSGMVCLTASLNPYCGRIPDMPGAFAAFGYHGNGVAMGSLCGAWLAALARGVEPEHPIPRAFAAPPPPFPLGPLRRGWLAAEYAWARLTDR